ncbi:AvrBs1/Avra family type III secretion system effector [Xanthomonas hortorum]|uniref:Avirulence protein n=1 Tax=Xanthomonas hortorum pv. gardneri TaxID=2754056 RepID=A0A6V7BN56_9XANT|nr:AvrBs1/Avra family type III secretion system effector [Xanthomonas hortorum]APP82161.1 Avirulence protein A [Xanthomonas hortorum pv. gardneri]EGD20588.1 Putative type III effector belonging to avrBs1 class [Xanthomonas hortorum ATCC 19865]MCC8498004.1 Avirulence protein A [Xanthomonas hortorum pv. gardneri]MCC8507738.1 Avirulence protein A [Xanthomonas hortorum pv. gardneri]MCC8511755.1 Avirulence protein A [Xanthomonas hortorum pv. gardneri]
MLKAKPVIPKYSSFETSETSADSVSAEFNNNKSIVDGKESDTSRFSVLSSSLSPAPQRALKFKKSYSAATIDGKIYHPNEKTDSSIVDFLSQSLSNNAYRSEKHLRRRAFAYINHINAENKLISNACLAMKDVSSFAHKQSEWLCHLERSSWKDEPALQRRDRQQLGDEILGLKQPDAQSPYAKPRAWRISDQAASAFAMMLKGELGPFTKEQVKTGFELCQEGELLAGRLKIQARMAFRLKNRHDANRSGTHSVKSTSGMHLSNDVGTQIREFFQIPVMSGTSGTSSDVVIAARYAAMHSGLQWSAPELTVDQAKDALIDLSLDFFRQNSPAIVMALRMNSVRKNQGLPHKEVDRYQVFTHSYAEIHGAISLTIDGIDPTDKAGVENQLYSYTLDAKATLMKTAGRLIEEATGRSETAKINVASLQTPQLRRVIEKKKIVQKVAELYNKMGKVGNFSALEEIINESSVKDLLVNDKSEISRDYADGKPLMVRSLRFSHDREATNSFGSAGKTPAKREIDTLCNNSTAFDIVMTPFSIINAKAKGATISEMKVPHRPKWKGLPSVLYKATAVGDLPEYAKARPGFGDVHSFNSNKAFNSEFARVCNLLSHAEKMGLIENSLKHYIKPDPDRNSYDFHHSLDDLVDAQCMLQSRKPGSILRHNEYCAKLELWDAKAIEVGESRSVAVATLIEFNIEMLSAARYIEDEGYDGKLISDFLERQLSWLGQNAALGKEDTLKKLSGLSFHERKTVAEKVCEALRQGVSLCIYEKNKEGSRIRELSLLDFNAYDIMRGIELFLSSKLLQPPTAAGPTIKSSL